MTRARKEKTCRLCGHEHMGKPICGLQWIESRPAVPRTVLVLITCQCVGKATPKRKAKKKPARPKKWSDAWWQKHNAEMAKRKAGR